MKSVKRYWTFVLFGAVFGFILSRAGATRYDVIHEMFIFSNFQLIWVIGAAVALNMIAFQLLARSRWSSANGGSIQLPNRVLHPGTFPGALLFGVGWALTGICPGTVMAQLGESGGGSSLVMIAGIFTGAWIYPKVHRRFFGWQATGCGG